MIVVVMFIGLVGLILINVPIAVALGVVAMGAMVYSGGFDSLINAGYDGKGHTIVIVDAYQSPTSCRSSTRMTRFTGCRA